MMLPVRFGGSHALSTALVDGDLLRHAVQIDGAF
jgi:hypothetical protein